MVVSAPRACSQKGPARPVLSARHQAPFWLSEPTVRLSKDPENPTGNSPAGACSPGFLNPHSCFSVPSEPAQVLLTHWEGRGEKCCLPSPVSYFWFLQWPLHISYCTSLGLSRSWRSSWEELSEGTDTNCKVTTFGSLRSVHGSASGGGVWCCGSSRATAWEQEQEAEECLQWAEAARGQGGRGTPEVALRRDNRDQKYGWRFSLSVVESLWTLTKFSVRSVLLTKALCQWILSWELP